MADVERAADDWGLRPASNEARFVNALIGCIRWLSRLMEAGQASAQRIATENRKAAEHELSQVRELTRSVTLLGSQARNAQLASTVEKEKLVARMIEEVFPIFAEKLQGALVIREKDWNAGVRQQRYLMVGLVLLALFVAGYAARAWTGMGGHDAIAQCLSHAVNSGGHTYCDVSYLAAG